VVAGINLAPERPGYQRILFRPRPGGSLASAGARLDSLYGRIESRWTRAGQTLDLNIAVPPNTEGVVYLTAASAAAVTEGSLPLSQAEGILSVTEDDGQLVVRVGSGRYAFSLRGNE
jgi:alpha-L-rhamnosidase